MLVSGEAAAQNPATLARARVDILRQLSSSVAAIAPALSAALAQLDAGREAASAVAPLADIFNQVRADAMLAADVERSALGNQSFAGSAAVAARQAAADASLNQQLARLAGEIDAILAAAADNDRARLASALRALAARLAAFADESDRTPLGVTLPFRSLTLAPAVPAAGGAVVPAYADIRLPAPTAADLAATLDAPLTPDIVAEAQSLQQNPIAIFEFVQNQIDIDFYSGAMASAREVLRTRRGNDVDQASLLIALMRASGVPARYVRGTIVLPAPQAQRWTGLGSPRRVSELLARAGIPFREVIQGGAVAAFELDHTWTEVAVAYANYRGAPLDPSRRVWIPLDPSIKSYDVSAGVDVLQAAGFNADALLTEYLSAAQPLSPTDFYKKKIADYLAQSRPDLTFEQVIRRRTIRPVSLGLLPSTLPYATAAIVEETAALSAAVRQRVRFVAGGDDGPGFDVTLSAAELAGQRVTLSYIPATVDDQAVIDASLGLDNTPAYLVNLRAVLKVGGVVRAVSQSAVQMGAMHAFTVEVQTPRATLPIVNSLLAGGYYAVALGAHGGPAAANASTPGSTSSADTAPVSPDDTDAPAGAQLYAQAVDYLRRWDDAEQALSEMLGAHVVRPAMAEVIVGTAYRRSLLFGQPQAIEWRGVFVDADLRISEPVPYGNDDQRRVAFMKLSGLAGSAAEAEVLEGQLQVESVSAARLLQLAAAAGIPVDSIDQSNAAAAVAQLQTASVVKTEIADAVNQGFVALVPRRDFTHNAWSGIGYILLDPGSGAGGYFISGGLAGGMTSLSPEDWVLQQYADLYGHPYSGAPNQDSTAAVFIEKVDITDQQSGGSAGERLPKPMAVWVRDENGRPVRGAEVTFAVLAGGGDFTGDPNVNFAGTCLAQPNAYHSVTVITNYLGIARAVPCLGQHTADAPFYVLDQPGDKYPSQVGNNLFTASVRSARGDIVLDEPFQQFGYPGRADHIVKVLGGDDHPLEAIAGVWAGTIRARVEDKFSNPIANAKVDFTVTPQIPYAEPQSARDPLATPYPGGAPAGAINLTIFRLGSCGIAIPSIGDCNAVGQLTLETSIFGASVDAILGNTVNTRFRLQAGVVGACDGVCVGTFSLYSRGSRPYGTGDYNKPVVWMTASQLVNDRGQLLNATKVGTRFPRPLATALFLIEDNYQIIRATPVGTDCGASPKPPCWRFQSLETNRTRPIDVHRDGVITFATRTGSVDAPKNVENAVVDMRPVAGGGTVDPPLPLNPGNGRYEAFLTVGASPLLNKVEADAVTDVWVPYLDVASGDVTPVIAQLQAGQAAGGFDTSQRDSSNAGPRPIASGLPMKVGHEVFGVKVTAKAPTRLRLNDAHVTTENAPVQYTIEPPEYAAQTADVDLFQLTPPVMSEQWLGLIIGDKTSGAGTATLYQGVKLIPADSYRLQAVLNRGSEAEIRSDKVNLTLLSGKLTYTRYPIDPANGIVYANPQKLPIRGAVVELRDQQDHVLQTAMTTEQGFVNFVGPATPQLLHLVVKAALGDPAAAGEPHVQVVDNTRSNELYTLNCDPFIADAAQSVSGKDCNAESGWDAATARYGGAHAREAAPFAIMDVIHSAEKLLLGVDPSVTLPPLQVQWSDCNQDTAGAVASRCYSGQIKIDNPAIGLIGATNYSNGRLQVRGLVDVDTDEYDTAVIAHEWGHYFFEKFSRDDTIGGSHQSGDVLDPRVAYSEGIAHAISAIVRGDGLLLDSEGPGQGQTTVTENLDQLPDTTTDANGLPRTGIYAEDAVGKLTWALSKAFGFKPLYDVLRGSQRTTPAFTTMTSFLVNLEQHYPAVLGIGQRISAVARAFNMDDRDIYGFLSVAADAAPTYIAVPIDGAYIDKDLALDPLQALATRSEFGATFPGNKLLNRRFFRFTVPANTQPQLEVRAAEFEDFTFSVFRSGTRVRLQTTGTGGFGTYTLPLSPVDVDYVMEVHSSQRAAQFKLRLCPGACTP